MAFELNTCQQNLRNETFSMVLWWAFCKILSTIRHESTCDCDFPLYEYNPQRQ